MASESESIEVERTSGTPAGWKAKLKGRDPFPYVIILVLLIGIAYMATFNLRMWGEPFDLQKSFRTHNETMDQQHTNYINGVGELTYVMSVCLNPARMRECEQLRLHMPESLYRKLNNAQQP